MMSDTLLPCLKESEVEWNGHRCHLAPSLLGKCCGWRCLPKCTLGEGPLDPEKTSDQNQRTERAAEGVRKSLVGQGVGTFVKLKRERILEELLACFVTE